MLKIHQLDPRHEHLLEDHSSGWWWIRPTHKPEKYKGQVIWAEDFAEQLRKGVIRKVSQRQLHGQLIKFKSHGYVYSGVDFIKLIDADSQDQIPLEAAKQVKRDLVTKLKFEARAIANHKIVLKKYGPDYKGPRYKRNKLEDRKERTLWVWGFQNKELNKKFSHIFTFIDNGEPIGKSRTLFASMFGLNYKQLNALAAGTIKAHQGWTLIGKPLKVTHRQAIAMKIKELSSK